MSDPFRRGESAGALGSDLREAAGWLVELLFERPAPSPAVEQAVAIEPGTTRLARGRRIAFVSLVAGCGTTSTAALVAQRSGGGGGRVRLVDLDLVAPTIALLAGHRDPTVADALTARGELRARRWGSIEAIFGSALELGAEGGEALGELVRRSARDAAVVIDAGTLGSPASDAVLRACDSVLYVATPRAAHVHAAARASALLSTSGLKARLVLARCDPAAAPPLAAEIGLPLFGAVPEDPYLARDEFRVRAETARAIDQLCAGLAA